MNANREHVESKRSISDDDDADEADTKGDALVAEIETSQTLNLRVSGKSLCVTFRNEVFVAAIDNVVVRSCISTNWVVLRPCIELMDVDAIEYVDWQDAQTNAPFKIVMGRDQDRAAQVAKVQTMVGEVPIYDEPRHQSPKPLFRKRSCGPANLGDSRVWTSCERVHAAMRTLSDKHNATARIEDAIWAEIDDREMRECNYITHCWETFQGTEKRCGEFSVERQEEEKCVLYLDKGRQILGWYV